MNRFIIINIISINNYFDLSKLLIDDAFDII